MPRANSPSVRPHRPPSWVPAANTRCPPGSCPSCSRAEWPCPSSRRPHPWSTSGGRRTSRCPRRRSSPRSGSRCRGSWRPPPSSNAAPWGCPAQTASCPSRRIGPLNGPSRVERQCPGRRDSSNPPGGRPSRRRCRPWGPGPFLRHAQDHVLRTVCLIWVGRCPRRVLRAGERRVTKSLCRAQNHHRPRPPRR